MNFDYHIESKPSLDGEEFRLSISDDIRGFRDITCTTDWTADRFEMYHDAIAFINSLIAGAEELKLRIIKDITEALNG